MFKSLPSSVEIINNDTFHSTNRSLIFIYNIDAMKVSLFVEFDVNLLFSVFHVIIFLYYSNNYIFIYLLFYTLCSNVMIPTYYTKLLFQPLILDIFDIILTF